MIKTILVCLTILLSVFLPLAGSQYMRLDTGTATTTRTDASQVIPPIITSSQSAIASCTLLELMPGSVVQGQSGFIKATCPDVGSAMVFHGSPTESASFIATGWTNILLTQGGFPCSFTTHSSTDGHLIAVDLITNPVISFTSDYSNTTLYAGGGMGYNYCMFYSNPSAGGIATFTISWSP